MYLVMKRKNRHTQDCPVVNNGVWTVEVKSKMYYKTALKLHVSVRLTMSSVK